MEAQIKNLEETINREYEFAEEKFDKAEVKKKRQLKILEEMKFYSSENRKKKCFQLGENQKGKKKEFLPKKTPIVSIKEEECEENTMPKEISSH